MKIKETQMDNKFCRFLAAAVATLVPSKDSVRICFLTFVGVLASLKAKKCNLLLFLLIKKIKMNQFHGIFLDIFHFFLKVGKIKRHLGKNIFKKFREIDSFDFTSFFGLDLRRH